MNLAAKQHPLESLVEWVAPVPLAFAMTWSARTLGLGLAEAAAVAIATFTLGVFAIKRIGGVGNPRPIGFEPATMQCEEFEPGELLLEAKDEVLLLDDPLTEVAGDSRVVRLFARQEPTPGELVERIADFLGDGPRTLPVPEAQADAAPPSDASAALHAALANIRASLR